MPREIKFRGWHTKLNRMISAEELAADQLTLLTTGEFINVHGSSTELSEVFPREKFVPLQYTGLKDKNGVEIYEGDILRLPQEIITVCEYHVSGFSLYGRTDKDRGPYVLRYTYLGTYPEIIGNIYENPELLA